jgi:hypothetical protein
VTLSPRVKLLLVACGFAVPIAASYLAYYFSRPQPSANYGELLLPPATLSSAPFAELRGRWVLAMWDSGACAAACTEKLTTLRQVRLALGRNASRVARVYVIDDSAPPDAAALQPFEGTVVATAAPKDRNHVYLVDPHGNVMMRWPMAADRKRMVRDLERLLKASQIG